MFDIIVPTYNRYYALGNFFSKISFLDKSKYTLWLIDDCSSEKDPTIIPNWSNIKYMQLPKNIGQAGARNHAIKQGTAPYVISLDDDAWFLDTSPNFELIRATFEKFPDTGCLMFNIATPKTSFAEDVDGKILSDHVACGCVYKREAITAVKGFNTILQGQGEESDIALKLCKAGYETRSLYSVHVFHDFEPDERSVEWYVKIRYRETRNSLIVAYLHYPSSTLYFSLLRKAIGQLVYAIKAKKAVWQTFFKELEAILDFLRMIPKLRYLRDPLSDEQFKKWRSFL